jgi:uncharacterized protein (TIGR00369 family)
VTISHNAGESGLDILRRAASEPTNNRAGIDQLIGLRFDEVAYGRTVMSLTTRPDMANPMGTVHGGITATLLDTVMGCAVHTTLGAGVSFTTLEIKVNYVRAARTDRQHLTGTGTVIHAGGRTCTAEGTVHDDAGKLIAHATTTCLILSPGN